MRTRVASHTCLSLEQSYAELRAETAVAFFETRTTRAKLEKHNGH